MSVLGALIPLLVLAAAVWAVIGATRRIPGEPFTLASAFQLYARFATVVTIALTLAGLGLLIKVLISYVSLGYSYYSASCATPAPGTIYKSLSPCGANSDLAGYMRSQDLILALILVAAGAALALLHVALIRMVQAQGHRAPSWVEGGSLVTFTVVSGLLGVGGFVAGLYEVLSQLVLGGGPNGAPPSTFGGAIGVGVAFLPAWLFSLRLLLRQMGALRGTSPTA
ncbi:MAG TPA: hypothetical protein VNI34_05520 [Candidatus Nitrosotalea sp.]|nr:hypothetical protein [Candidatus Nitrosotalea sp.]